MMTVVKENHGERRLTLEINIGCNYLTLIVEVSEIRHLSSFVGLVMRIFFVKKEFLG